MNPKPQCNECALLPGGEANCEPENNLKAALCALGGIPFWCHHGLDWQNPENHKAANRAEARAKVQELGMRICGGWAAEVARLKSVGYFNHIPEAKKAFAQVGIQALNEIPDLEPGPKREEALKLFEWAYLELQAQEMKATTGKEFHVENGRILPGPHIFKSFGQSPGRRRLTRRERKLRNQRCAK